MSLLGSALLVIAAYPKVGKDRGDFFSAIDNGDAPYTLSGLKRKIANIQLHEIV
jgi:hypothetical protein